MNGSVFYGPKGRVVSGVAGAAGVLAALLTAAQQADLFSLVPPKYTPYITAVPIISLFFTLFSERLQGGASRPDVRIAAHKADIKNELELTTKKGSL